MKNLFILFITMAVMISCQKKSNSPGAFKWPDVKAPVCEKKEKELLAHSDKRIDPYYWLNDYFKQGPDSGKVIEYLNAENAYLDTMMSGLKPLQERLYKEMRARILEKDESVPWFKNGYYYYTRTLEGSEYYLVCRKKGSLNAAEEVILDINAMAKGHDYFDASGFDISPDNRYLAYGVDTVSRRQYSIYVKDLISGKVTLEVRGGTSGDPVWAGDNETFFYVRNNPKTLLSENIIRHGFGKPEAEDVTVYTEKDPSNYIRIWRSKSDRYLFIQSEATLSSEIRYLEADKPLAGFTLFQPRIPNVLYGVEHQNDRFIIVTNLDALNFRLMETPLHATGKDSWKELIAHRPDVLLEGAEVFRDYLVVTERRNGLTEFRIRDLQSGKETYLPFDEPAYAAFPGQNSDYNSTVLRYNYTSLTTPSSVYDYDLKKGSRTLMKRQPVLGSFKPEDYVTERLYAPAPDGKKVPISIVYKKGTPKDGSAPLLLYGYGSYGNSMDAYFSSTRLSLLDRGFIFALAHVRGGQELGRSWYEDGKLMKKMNTFTDFIACADFLVKERYTTPLRMYAMGGSAGGLLMGAIANLRPELWHGIIAQVPFVDVVTTMSDPSIPLTTNEYDEWGNPADKDAYFYMKSYSPYDNVERKAYPNMLVMTGLHDSQVQYFEPAKWVAKLRELKTDNNVLLLHTDMEVGHGGASGRFQYLKDVALEYSFLFALEGITE